MKKLSLNETWEQCLKMWRWIVRQPCPRNVDSLKKKWLEKNEFTNYIDNDCFFCDYGNWYKGCNSCPGRKIDRGFDCCNDDYDYCYKPAAFLRKITELNEKRLTKKGKK